MYKYNVNHILKNVIKPTPSLNNKLGKRFQHQNNSLSLLDFDSNSILLKQQEIFEAKHDLILTILNSTATKREARSYLSKYRLLEENDIYKNKQKIIDFDQSDVKTPLVINKKYSSYIEKLLDKYKETDNNSLELDDEKYKTSESPVIMTSPNTPHSRINGASNEIKLTKTIRSFILRISRLDKWDRKTMNNLGVVLRKAMSLGASPIIIIDGNIIDGCDKLLKKEKENYLDAQLETFTNELRGLLPCRVVQGCFDLQDDGSLVTVIPEMIGVPIFSGIVPIISPCVIRSGSLIKDFVDGIELTREIVDCLEHEEINDILSVEKVVLVDEVGGFPSVERSDGSHVLINLLQEYDDIEDELANKLKISEFDRQIHLSHLHEMKNLLDKHPSITGILTTPVMATTEEEKQVGKETNPIIYNILTDRPTISSSLPVSLRRTPQLNTTVVKHGMEVSVFLANNQNEGLDLIEMEKEGKISLDKLKHLIDDSFGRNLNMNHYLTRINKKVAGLIIAGDYEGCAIITWEDTGDRVVAYLDKFAVIKKLQGIPGIADVVFKAMTTNFSDELLWRSRKNNPVNKWYFERSNGNHSIKGTQWRLFIAGKKMLTTENLEGYVKVCSSIEPSFDV